MTLSQVFIIISPSLNRVLTGTVRSEVRLSVSSAVSPETGTQAQDQAKGQVRSQVRLCVFYLEAQVRDDGGEAISSEQGHHQLLQTLVHFIVLHRHR